MLINGSKLKITSPNVLFGQQPEAIKFIVTEEERNHIIKVVGDHLNS